MSLTRALVNEFRPFFRVFDDPFFTSPDPFALYQNRHRRHRGQPRQNGDLMSELGFGEFRTPRVDVVEKDNKYVVNAEVPGIKREELEVSIGDGGRSLTIQAHSTSSQEAATAPRTSNQAIEASTSGAAETQVAESSNQELVKRQSTPQSWSSYSFSRTIWLPRPADPATVNAKLDHGILTLEIPKQEDAGSQKIEID